jgi:hypothetical protein
VNHRSKTITFRAMAFIPNFGGRVISVIHHASRSTRFMTQPTHLASSPKTLLSRHHSNTQLRPSSIQKAIREGYHDTFIIDEEMPPKKKRGNEKYTEDDFVVEESGSEPEPKRSKTAKNPKEKSKASVPDGKKFVDEEGNAYWEVCLPFPCWNPGRNVSNTPIAWRASSPRHAERVQGQNPDQHPRALREGWQGSAGKEGTCSTSQLLLPTSF